MFADSFVWILKNAHRCQNSVNHPKCYDISMSSECLNDLYWQQVCPVSYSWSAKVIYGAFYNICLTADFSVLFSHVVDQFRPWVPFADSSTFFDSFETLWSHKDIWGRSLRHGMLNLLELSWNWDENLVLWDLNCIGVLQEECRTVQEQRLWRQMGNVR